MSEEYRRRAAQEEYAELSERMTDLNIAEVMLLAESCVTREELEAAFNMQVAYDVQERQL